MGAYPSCICWDVPPPPLFFPTLLPKAWTLLEDAEIEKKLASVDLRKEAIECVAPPFAKPARNGFAVAATVVCVGCVGCVGSA